MYTTGSLLDRKEPLGVHDYPVIAPDYHDNLLYLNCKNAKIKNL